MKAITLLMLLLYANCLFSQERKFPADIEIMNIQQMEFAFSEMYPRVPKIIRLYLDSIYGSKFKVMRKGRRVSSDVKIGFGRKARAIKFIAQNDKYAVICYEHSGRGKHYHTLVFSLSDNKVLRAYNFISMNFYDFDYFKMQIRNKQAYEPGSFDDI